MWLLSFSVLLRVGSALELTDFGFEWQQRISSLGLEANNATSRGCELACAWLEQILPEPEVLPSATAAWKEKAFFWSAQQAEVAPQCFVQPTSPEDVAAIVKLAEHAACPFAVKSGGHGAFAGASNIEGGITIDLSLLNELTVSEDKATTRIGPGNRWTDVYGYLTPKRLAVVGGRVPEIGVGGLVLGGGISYFSNRHGWALDGVRNFEVVVASGEVLDVNYTSYPDLYWALRGGGNNFGIVTRFDLETFPQGGMWGGMSYHDFNASESLMDAFEQFAHRSSEDVDAAAYIIHAWAQSYGVYVTGSILSYARPVAEPPIFANFSSLPTSQSSLRLTNMTDLLEEFLPLNPNGMRNSYWTATFAMNKDMMRAARDIFVEEMETIKDVESIFPALVFQVISKDITARFSRNGGNCLGIADDEGPLVNLLLPVMWKNAEDDEAVLGAARRIIGRSVEKAKEMGVHHRYIYQNYAAQEQAVFAGYGEENLERLREISRKYDPRQVFQRLQPGYFKL